MTDYAAAAVQPIVQGLVVITGPIAGGPVTFTGRGAKLLPSANGLGRSNANPIGVIVLTLDEGLPGNAGAIEPIPNNAVPPAVGPFAPLARTMVSLRSPSPGNPTNIDSVSVTYGNFTVATPMDGSLQQVEIIFAVGAVPTDPFTTGVGGSNGFEIVVWEGVESP